MPRGFRNARRRYQKRRAVQARRRRRRSKKVSGLNSKERSQVKTIAQQAVVKLSEPKRVTHDVGDFNADITQYSYGQPAYIANAGQAGVLLTNKTQSIPIGGIAQGSSAYQRVGLRAIVRGFRQIMCVSWDPSRLTDNVECRFRLVSTMNDPAGGNLGFIPGAQQDAQNHVPTLLLPPSDTLGYLYMNSPLNMARQDLDVREYQKHWTKSVMCKQDDSKTFATRTITVPTMFKRPLVQQYAGTGSGAILGRKYFLLFNSTTSHAVATSQNFQAPQVHMRLWTYFRDEI